MLTAVELRNSLRAYSPLEGVKGVFLTCFKPLHPCLPSRRNHMAYFNGIGRGGMSALFSGDCHSSDNCCQTLS